MYVHRAGVTGGCATTHPLPPLCNMVSGTPESNKYVVLIAEPSPQHPKNFSLPLTKRKSKTKT